MPKQPLKLRELLGRLRKYGVEVYEGRGKGSEIILIRPTSPGAKKGPQYPIKNHGDGTEITVAVVKACLRRFNISESEFWD